MLDLIVVETILLIALWIILLVKIGSGEAPKPLTMLTSTLLFLWISSDLGFISRDMAASWTITLLTIFVVANVAGFIISLSKKRGGSGG